jgi:hypothetical protein
LTALDANIFVFVLSNIQEIPSDLPHPIIMQFFLALASNYLAELFKSNGYASHPKILK